jgi:hypothetical protein
MIGTTLEHSLPAGRACLDFANMPGPFRLYVGSVRCSEKLSQRMQENHIPLMNRAPDNCEYRSSWSGRARSWMGWPSSSIVQSTMPGA